MGKKSPGIGGVDSKKQKGQKQAGKQDDKKCIFHAVLKSQLYTFNENVDLRLLFT
jgi:hypothetical protein